MSGDDEVIFTVEDCTYIREALLIGLTALGETEKAMNWAQVYAFKHDGKRPEGWNVVHADDAEGISKFATALALLERAVQP